MIIATAVGLVLALFLRTRAKDHAKADAAHVLTMD